MASNELEHGTQCCFSQFDCGVFVSKFGCYKFIVRPVCGVFTSPLLIPHFTNSLQQWIAVTDTLGSICCSHNAWANLRKRRTDDPRHNSYWDNPFDQVPFSIAATISTLCVVNHHATRGYIAYHVGSAIKELWRNEKDMQKRTHQLFIYFIMTKCTC